MRERYLLARLSKDNLWTCFSVRYIFFYLPEEHKGPWSEQEHGPSLPGFHLSVVLCFLVHPRPVVLNADKAKLGQGPVRQLVQFDFK